MSKKSEHFIIKRSGDRFNVYRAVPQSALNTTGLELINFNKPYTTAEELPDAIESAARVTTRDPMSMFTRSKIKRYAEEGVREFIVGHVNGVWMSTIASGKKKKELAENLVSVSDPDMRGTRFVESSLKNRIAQRIFRQVISR